MAHLSKEFTDELIGAIDRLFNEAMGAPKGAHHAGVDCPFRGLLKWSLNAIDASTGFGFKPSEIVSATVITAVCAAAEDPAWAAKFLEHSNQEGNDDGKATQNLRDAVVFDA